MEEERGCCFGNPACPSPSWKEKPPVSSPAVSAASLVNVSPSLPSSPGPGGTHCLGASVEHTVCENLPCPKGLPSFRDQQCQTHDRLSSKKKGLLTAVVVDGKDTWHIFQGSFPLPSPSTINTSWENPQASPPPKSTQSCLTQLWTPFLSHGLNLDDPAQ